MARYLLVADTAMLRMGSPDVCPAQSTLSSSAVGSTWRSPRGATHLNMMRCDTSHWPAAAWSTHTGKVLVCQAAQLYVPEPDHLIRAR